MAITRISQTQPANIMESLTSDNRVLRRILELRQKINGGYGHGEAGMYTPEQIAGAEKTAIIEDRDEWTVFQNWRARAQAGDIITYAESNTLYLLLGTDYAGKDSNNGFSDEADLAARMVALHTLSEIAQRLRGRR